MSVTCEQCGSPIETTDWYPVSRHEDSDGSMQFYAFCSEACQNAWQPE